MSTSTFSQLSAPNFIATKSAEQIANRLREDESLINIGQPCSWVAWHLPKHDRSIAAYLAPAPGLSNIIKQVIYENVVDKIRRYLKKSFQEGHNAAQGTSRSRYQYQDPLHLSTTLDVLNHLLETGCIQQDTPVRLVLSQIELLAHLQKKRTSTAPKTPVDDAKNHHAVETPRPTSPTTPATQLPVPPPVTRKRLCYLCRLYIHIAHPTHPSFCIPCGEFNTASQQLSLPPRFSLPSTFNALVTGARLNLGFHTALRLLRAGARVIATSRYPRDAVARYLSEGDAAEWQGRLRVVGADFRCAADAFSLVGETRRCLQRWAEADGETEGRLHLLVNNAAQTLTDSKGKEGRAVRREAVLAKETGLQELLTEGAYRARVRGEALPLALEEAGDETGGNEGNDSWDLTTASVVTDVEPYAPSSWVQSLSDIPYEDVISAHSVNTFVPLILIRELLPLMGHRADRTADKTADTHSSDALPNNSDPTSPPIPAGYIINVSSREGIFEDNTKSSAKHGKHVHTNMSKAALNMITETEALPAWHNRRVAMNTVDPGYMSAAPEYEDAHGGVRPIGWEDGAGRVLWPVAVAEGGGEVVRGRFLKHYGAVEVEPGLGRG